MEKTILFVVLEPYADWEAAYLSSAIYLLGKGNFQVKTVSLTKEKIRSIGGFYTVPDYDIHAVPAEYEALILIGGMAWRNESAQQIRPLVEDCLRKGKILGGICDASVFLGKMGVLNRGRHTSNDLNDLKQWAGDDYTGETNYIMMQAISDQNIVTANGTAPLEFAKEILLLLQIAEKDTIDEWYNFYKLGCYCAPMPQL